MNEKILALALIFLSFLVGMQIFDLSFLKSGEYNETDMMRLLIVVCCSIIIGAVITYMLIRRREEFVSALDFETTDNKELRWNETVKALRGDEQILYKEILDSKGEIMQSDIPTITKFSKAKVTRILDSMEQRGLVERKSYGMTNKVVLK